jgi:hypothetical protein
MPATQFPIDAISRRDGRGGLDGLRYSKRPAVHVKPVALGQKPPTFGSKVFKTMSASDRVAFEEETIERSRFLDAKVNLAGKRDVSEFEDREVLRFDPVSKYKQEMVGALSHDSGKFQGGETGESYLRGGKNPDGRPTTLKQPNPYHVALSNRIHIKQ